jgi:hypothetical protein
MNMIGSSVKKKYILDSRMSMEQIKTAFRLVFLPQEDREFQMTWSNFFKEFSLRQECEKFEFGQFALSLIFQSKSSRKEKLSCVFKLVTSFQNLPTKKGLSLESLHSIIE